MRCSKTEMHVNIVAAVKGIHMCRLRNIAMRDYLKSVTTGQTDTGTDRRTDRQTPDKVIPMCPYASQATQKLVIFVNRATKRPNSKHNKQEYCKF